MIDFRSNDELAWQRIANEPKTTFFVEAAAGTGKTSSLVARAVSLIRSNESRIANIAAVTFTRKAAAELRERIQIAVEREVPNAVADLHKCFVGTIHSFCARLLRERPVEAGVEPDFIEMDEMDDAIERRRAWDAFTEHLFIDDDPVLGDLDELGIQLDELYQTYSRMIDYSDVTSPVDTDLQVPDFNELAIRIVDFVDKAWKMSPRLLYTQRDSFQRMILTSHRLISTLDLERPRNLVRLLNAMNDRFVLDQDRWISSRLTMDQKKSLRASLKALETEFKDLRDLGIVPALQQWTEYAHPILMRILRRAVQEYERLRSHASRLNFQDILIRTRNMLRDHPEVRRHFQSRFTHLLIDEFQDTDPIQAEIMFYLTGEDIHEKNWRLLRARPGSLFVVGDPRQSIYRFRRADIEIYEKVKHQIEDSGGHVLKLEGSYRSMGTLCEWLNDTFGSIFPESATSSQAGAAHLSTYRSKGTELSGVFHIVEPMGGSENRVADGDAALIADWIRVAIDGKWMIDDADWSGNETRRSVKPSDLLIVTSQRSRLHIYARALEERGVPYVLSGGKSFGQSEELTALLVLLRAAADPDDAVSLIAFLRGMLCGIDDNTLYQFRKNGGRFGWHIPIDESLSGDESFSRLLQGLSLVRETADRIRRLPAAAALDHICSRLGMVAHSAACDLGDTRCGNLLKALTLARTLSAKGAGMPDIIDHLDALCDSDQPVDVEEMVIEPGRTDAVRIMNLHRVKGLEAPIVFLADPNPRKGPGPEYHIDRDTDPPLGHFLIVNKVKAGHSIRTFILGRPSGWEEKCDDEGVFRDAEEDRLLYVAATRARNMLVVSKHSTDDNSAWHKLGSRIKEQIPLILRQPGSAPSKDLSFLPQELKAELRTLETCKESAKMPSYAVTQVTKVKRAEGGALARERTGRGASWGRVLHGALEILMRRTDVDLRGLVENLLVGEERSRDEGDEMLKLIKAVQESELWQRAMRAEKRYVEVPFAQQVTSQDIGIHEGPAETIIHGTIDLVFQEDDRWTIVDYKTDHVTDLDALVRFYRPQVETYRRHWEELTRAPTRAALYFVDGNDVIWLE